MRPKNRFIAQKTDNKHLLIVDHNGNSTLVKPEKIEDFEGKMLILPKPQEEGFFKKTITRVGDFTQGFTSIAAYSAAFSLSAGAMLALLGTAAVPPLAPVYAIGFGCYLAVAALGGAVTTACMRGLRWLAS